MENLDGYKEKVRALMRCARGAAKKHAHTDLFIRYDNWTNRYNKARTLADMSQEEIAALEAQYNCKVLLNPPPLKKAKRTPMGKCIVCGGVFKQRYGWKTRVCSQKCRAQRKKAGV